MNQQPNYDSEFCGSVPIHLINSVQPYGALIVLDKVDFTVLQASENVTAIFGLAVESFVGTGMAAYLAGDAIAFLQKVMAGPPAEKIPLLWPVNGQQYPVQVHIKDTYLLAEIDLEPFRADEQNSFVSVYQELKYAMANMEAATTVEAVCEIAVKELKRISGFDKIMIYRFDTDWNGTVIAEVMEEGMESYHGFTFPASDIPKQARLLYLKNPYRLIPDRNYVPVRLYPVINPLTQSFIDLSDCNVRSVASVHLEYLKNMGVTASMSTRILKDDQLWGLIACHHRTARYLNFQVCSVFELLSNILSLKVSSLQNKEKHAFETAMQSDYRQLVEQIYRGPYLHAVLLDTAPGLMQLLGGSGAAVSYKGKLYTAGNVPDTGSLEDLVLWLHTRQLRKVYSLETLSAILDQAEAYKDVASGLLVIPLNYARDEYLMVFRPEVVRVINWGGNPDERIVFEKDEKNYHPRHSFKEWQQIVSGTSLPWKAEELAVAENLRSFLYEYTTSSHDWQ